MTDQPLQIRVEKNLSKAIINGIPTDKIEKMLQASAFVIEREYKAQVPVNTGRLLQNVKSKKKAKFTWVVSTRAIQNGKDYAVDLHEGTGKLKGMPDMIKVPRANLTRRGLVAWGIGGIRPNKYAQRAKTLKQKESVKIFNNLLKQELKKK